ncbi:MAG: autotransporter outer membrane beta-barrel domain-containing protein [Alphaproteobacteria bacterium]|nr:autotransporter outer membrane beta-barrel domain-containing protein [Alphaproteobacteria bacterium]
MTKVLLKRTLSAIFIFNFYISAALAFNPDEYTYKEQPIAVDGDEMVVLRIYDKGQEIEFSAEDLNSSEGDSCEVTRSFSDQDLTNVRGAMRYIKDVFGVPSEAPVIETLADTEENASFESATSGTIEGISGTRLSTWFMDQDKNRQLPTGILNVGEMGDKDGDFLYSLANKGEGAAMSSVIIHEMMHGLGISTSVDDDEDDDGDTFFYATPNNSVFSSHLYDIYDQQLLPGMIFEKGPVDDPDEDSFYQYNNGSQSGAYFWGDNVEEVLTVDGQTTELALPDGDLDGLTVKGIPVNGYELDYDDDDQLVEIPEMSHLELQNSMMSHQDYRNWGTFMEAELAVLQDIGFTNIDRRRFFGFSIYNNWLTYTNDNGFDSDQNWGIGLHLYGNNNTVTQAADIKTRGEAAYGVRIDGQENTLIVPDGVAVQANGKDNIGVLVSYGNSHVLNIQGVVEAMGSGGDALRFDFGGNLLGDQNEYRGSYFQVKKDDETGQWTDVDEDGTVDAINGPLAAQVDISGRVAGSKSAIYISDNALVREINILNGAQISGDIISDWSSAGNRYGNYGNGMTLFKPEEEADRTLLTFGFEPDDEGNATEDADPDFEMSYAGNIISADGFDVLLVGGKLTYGGNADVNTLQTEENTELALSNGNVAAVNFVGNGKVSAGGMSNIVVKTADGTAQFDDLTVHKQANLNVDAGTGTIEINTLQNSGNAEFRTDKIQKDQITIDTYAGTNDSNLVLNLDSNLANQLQSDSTEQMVQQGAQILTINNNQTSSDLNLHIAEGEISGEINAVVNPNGKLVAANEKKNTLVDALQKITSVGFQVFRAQMNDLEKRMGDLRDMPGESGAWAKFIAGQSKYKGLHNDYKTFQFGIDHRFGNFFAGLMGSHTDGKGKLKIGKADDKNYSYGLYGGWLGADGQFVDITLKHHHLKSDYGFNANGNHSHGRYSTSGNSASVEYGWRLGVGRTNFYVEPQTEFLYGYVDGADYVTDSGVKVKQSDVKSAVGRLGIATGWVSADKKGSVYVRASVLNDWKGDSKIVVSKGLTSRQYREDLGGTWGEFALGGTWNIHQNLSVYGEAETTTGGHVRTTYEFNAGLRLNF